MSRLLKLKEAARQPLFWAKQTHRLTGLVLAFFLPFHFWALSHALAGAGALSRVMRMSENPFYKISEWLLVFLLVFHLAGGLRIMWMEQLDLPASVKDALAWCAGFSLLVSLVFLFNRYSWF